MSAEPALKYSHVILLVCRLYTKNRMPERFCVQAFGGDAGRVACR